jgi:hypothetical protein
MSDSFLGLTFPRAGTAEEIRALYEVSALLQEAVCPELDRLRAERDTLRECLREHMLEIHKLRELVREQLDDGRTSWLEWKERAEKALEGKP